MCVFRKGEIQNTSRIACCILIFIHNPGEGGSKTCISNVHARSNVGTQLNLGVVWAE